MNDYDNVVGHCMSIETSSDIHDHFPSLSNLLVPFNCHFNMLVCNSMLCLQLIS